jgi:urease accessory protein
MPLGARLKLVQMLSPAFPVGGFAYSHGLEAAIASGAVTDADEARSWIEDIILRGSGRTDAVLLFSALQPDADHDALAGRAVAMAASKERLAETREQGAAFARTAGAATGRSFPPEPLPVAVGRAVSGLGLAAEEVVAHYLFALASQLVQVAVRFVPLGQTAGQVVLARLHAPILRAAGEAGRIGPDEVTSATFGADSAAMQHETMEVRIYRT